MPLVCLLTWLMSLAWVSHSADAQVFPKRIYIANDDHTDYMWSGDEAAYRQVFSQMIDYYLDQADATAGNPPDRQSRFNLDGSFWLRTYESNRTPDQVARLIARIKDGHIAIPLNTLVSCYGAQPTEAVLRGMYDAGRMERQYNFTTPLVASMENQALPYGLGSLWAGAGGRYCWYGVCACATRLTQPRLRPREIYWWTGADGSRILMKWNSMIDVSGHDGTQSIGGYSEAYDPAEAINLADSNPAFTGRYPYRVIGLFGFGWDRLSSYTTDFMNAAASQSDASRRVIISNERDFFEDFEATYGASLPSYGASFGNEWDLYSASLSEVSASVRRAVERLRGAEALATLVSLNQPGFMAARQAVASQAWVDLGLYWEHDWTADGRVTRTARANWQRRLAGEIKSYVDTLQNDAVAALGGMIRKSGSNPRFFVFNPLSWARTDAVDFPWSDTAPVHVVDITSGTEVPSQIVTFNGRQMVRILASQVPPVGYRVYELRNGSPAAQSGAASVSGNTIENEFYKLSLDGRGALTSLIDKKRGNREFVRVVGGRSLNDLGAGSGTVMVESIGPVSVTLRADASGPLAHTTRLTVYKGLPRIELANEITQNFSDVRTWGFGLALDNPDVWHEELGAVIRAKLLADGGHYSPENARYDWLTLNHFADMSAGGVGLTLSNADCAFMQLGNSSPSMLDTSTPLISVLAGGQVDGTSLGITGQGGDQYFLQRFALITHDNFDAAAAMRFSLEHQNPLICGVVGGGTDYPETSFSLLTISEPNTLLWTLKPAEDEIGRRVIVRLWNLSGQAANPLISLATGNITSAQRVSHIETPIAPASVVGGKLAVALAPWQIQTCRLDDLPSVPTPTPTPTPTPMPTPIVIWVDFSHSGMESGTQTQPFNTLSEGLTAVPPGGTVCIIGNTGVPYTLEHPRITKAVRLEAWGGTIRIGAMMPAGQPLPGVQLMQSLPGQDPSGPGWGVEPVPTAPAPGVMATSTTPIVTVTTETAPNINDSQPLLNSPKAAAGHWYLFD